MFRHTVEHGMITYKGLPAPVISDYLSREDPALVTRRDGVSHRQDRDGGEHRHVSRQSFSPVCAREGSGRHSICIRSQIWMALSCAAREATAITEECFSEIEVKDKAVLVHTGWDKHWRTEEYSSGNHPFLTEGAATYLAKNGATLVGIDSFNIDATRDGNRPAHSVLLGHDIPIVEHLCGLGDLPDSGFKFFAVPVKVRQFGTFPVRAFGIVSPRITRINSRNLCHPRLDFIGGPTCSFCCMLF